MTDEEREQLEQEIDEVLALKGQSAWYGWRPNQVSVRDPEHPYRYISTDVMADGSIDVIKGYAQAESERQVEAIAALGNSKLVALRQCQASFERMKSSNLQALYSLRGLFRQFGIPAAEAIIDGAIAQINAINIDEEDTNE